MGVAGGARGGEREVDAKGQEGIQGRGWNVHHHYLDYGDDFRGVYNVRIHGITYFKCLWFIVHQLYFNKAVTN